MVMTPQRFAGLGAEVDRFTAIAQIMRLRSECESEDEGQGEMPFFQAIPAVEKGQINHFLEEAGKTGSVVKGLKSVGFNTVFTPQVLEVVLDADRKENNFSVYSAVVVFYQAIAFFISQDEIDSDGACWLMRGINKAVAAGFASATIIPLLNSVVEKLITKHKLDWGKGLSPTVLEYYSQHRAFLKDKFKLFIVFCCLCLDAGDKECAGMVIHFLYDFLGDDGDVFSSEMLDSIVQRLVPYVHAFDVTALGILAYASKGAPSDVIMDCYMKMPGGLVELLKGDCCAEMFATKAAVWRYESVREVPKFNFEFIESTCFENGFVPLPEIFWEKKEHPTKVFTTKGQTLMTRIYCFLSESDPKYQKVFVDAYRLAVNVIEERGTFLAYLASFVYFLEHLSRCDLIESNVDLLVHEFLFYEEGVLFCQGTLDDRHSAIRGIVIQLLMETKHPNLIGQLLKLHKSKPFLFAEDLGRMIASLGDDRVELFLGEAIIEYVFDVAFTLQAMPTSNEVIIARNIVFLFIFMAAKTSFFGGRAFASYFYRFLFQSDISQMVVSALKEGCSVLHEHEAGKIVLSFQSLFVECAARKDDDRYGKMAITISNMIYESIQINPSLAKPFWKLFDSVVLCLKEKPSVEILIVIINMIALSHGQTVRPTIGRLLAGYIEEELPDNTKLFRKVINLLSLSDQYAVESFFAIERPELMAFVMSCCRSATMFRLFVKKLQILTAQSLYNVRQCQKGELDQILIKFLEQEKEGRAKFQYRGFDLCLSFDKENLNSVMIPLLVQMCCYYPSQGAAVNLLDLCRRGNNTAILVMNKILSHMKVMPAKMARLGCFKENVVATGLKGSDLQGEFTLCCWLRIDLSMSIASNSAIDLVHIVDSRGWSLSLFLNQQAIVLKYERERIKTVVQVVHVCPANRWFSLAVSFKMEGQHRLINTFVNLDKQSDSEMCAFQLDGPIKFIFGKTVTQKKWFDADFGIIGDVRIYNYAIKYREIERYAHRCPRPIKDQKKQFVLKFERGDPEPEHFCSFLNNKNVIANVIGAGTIALAPVISILKPMYLLSPGATIPADDVVDILNLTPGINANIYFCLYSFFLVLVDKRDWFDKVISNFLIWSRCDDDSRMQILQHWSSIVPDSCADLIRERSRFSSLLAEFDEYFGAEDANRTNRALFSLFLRRIAHVNLTIEDQQILFVFACGSKTTDMTREYLEILRDVASLLDESIGREHHLELLNMMLRHNQPDIVYLVLMILHEMTFQVDSMILAYLLPCCIDLEQVIQYLISQLHVCPRFSELCAILGLILGQDVSTSLVAICGVSGAAAQITRSNEWFLWPLFLLYQTPVTTIRLMMEHIALLISDVATLRHVLNLMILMDATISSLDARPSISEFLQIISEMGYARKKEVEVVIVQFCVCCFLFHTETSSHSVALMNAIHDSPFKCLDFEPDMRTLEKTCIISSNGVKKFFEAKPNVQLVYGIRYCEDGTSVDQDLLNLAWSIIERKDQPYEYADLVRYLRTHERNDGEVDMNELIPELSEMFNEMFHNDIDHLAKMILERLRVAEETTGNVQNMNFDPKGKNAILSVERKRLLSLSTPSVRTGIVTIRSHRLCDGHPALFKKTHLGTMKVLSLKKGANCSVVFSGMKKDAHISDKAKEITLKFEDKVCAIPTDKIEYISFRTKYQFEIGQKNGKTYLITMFNTTKAQTSLLNYRTGSDYQWKSTFDCLLWINRMAGRSFNDNEFYPIFPSILCDYDNPYKTKPLICDTSVAPVRCNQVTDLEVVLTKYKSLAPEFYCFPEQIKGVLPKWASTSYELVYSLRKILESDEMTAPIKRWIESFWSQESKQIWNRGPNPISRLGERIRPTVNRRVSDFTLNLGPLSFALACGMKIAVVSRFGVHSFEIDSELREISSVQLDRETLKDNRMLGYRTTVLLYNKYTRTVLPVGGKPEEIGLIDPSLFCTFGEMWIFGREAGEIWQCRKENFKTVCEPICHARHRLTALAVNEKYQNMVFATADGSLHFHMINGREIMEVPVMDLVTKIIITNVWGFVVAVSDSKLFVYNVNGTFVKSCELSYRIVCWSTFSSYDGFDYLVFADSSGRVRLMEVFYPDEVVTLLEIRDLLAVSVDHTCQQVVTVSGDGRVKVFPCDVRQLLAGRGFSPTLSE